MEIHKFGGASISTTGRIQHLPSIISEMKEGNKIFVVSALGKTTNALEEVAWQYFNGNKNKAFELLSSFKESHLEIAATVLTGNSFRDCKETFADLLLQLETSLEENLNPDYNFYYDQVVSFGELFSSRIIHYFLAEKGFENEWIDARQVIKTNQHFREAGVLWDITAERTMEKVIPGFQKCSIVITQGFIGSTLDDQPATLGREGSDFTAAVFANILNAESVTIWKDVDGVMNGDPRQVSNAVVIPHLDYKEVIEMSYYGAQVIHPKTIKPLQNKNIPLYVRSFLDPSLPGTVINCTRPLNLPPIIVYKFNQALISFQTRDFSFIEGKPSRLVNEIFAGALIKANLTQNTAISLLVCIDDISEKIEFVLDRIHELETTFTAGLALLTIRHHTPEIILDLTYGKRVILEQKTKETVQILYLQTES